MWHTFILFSRPYMKFCDTYFGFYIHHAPTTKAEKDAMKAAIQEDREKVLAQEEQDHEIQYNYIYDKLGEDTLVKWYSDYTDKYTTEYINQIRKPYA